MHVPGIEYIATNVHAMTLFNIQSTMHLSPFLSKTQEAESFAYSTNRPAVFATNDE